MQTVFTNSILDLLLANNQTGHATPGTGILGSGSVGLVTSDSVNYGYNNDTLGMLASEGGYPGYARKAITWNAASIADDGTVEAVGVVPEFRPTGSSSINAYGLFLTSSDSANIVGNGPLDGAPAPMGDTNSALVVTLRWRPTTGGLSVDVS
jgi:hypothetical protein